MKIKRTKKFKVGKYVNDLDNITIILIRFIFNKSNELDRSHAITITLIANEPIYIHIDK